MSGISITVSEPSKGIFLDVTRRAKACKASKGRHGNLRLTVAVAMDRDLAYAFSALAGLPKMELTYQGARLWEGRIEDITPSDEGLTLTALGKWRALSDISYTALWSDSGVKEWGELTDGDISTVTGTFQTDTKNRLYIAPRKGETIADGDRGGLYLKIPDSSSRNIVGISFDYEVYGSSLWKASLRRWADNNFNTPTEIWTPTLSGYGAYTGAVCTSFTGSPLLTFEFESEVAQTTLGTAINAVDTTLSPSSLRVNTTSGTAVAAPGTVTITPASMTNIVNGVKLLYNAGSTSLEKVTVSNVTGTTFDATFKNTHLTGVAIKSVDDWAVPEVDTTTTAGYASGARTITPATMANIVAGMTLIIGWGGEAEEEVIVSSVTATTFNVTLVYGHASGEKIRNGENSYSVRPQSMTGIVAGMNLEIGGRNSEVVNVASVTSTHFTASFKYAHPGDSSVTTAKRQTVTPASMTNIVKGREYRIGNEAGVTDSEPEKIIILETTGSTFTADFNNPHGSTDTLVRIYSGDYNAWLKVTNIRVVTSIANMVNTTIGSNISAGSQTVTPASMTGIYVGQKLVIDGSGVGDTGETVEVTAITSTTFTAVFAIAHTTAITVKGLVVYADEIAEDILSAVNTLNTGALSSSTILIQSPGVDMFDCVYEDKRGDEIVDELAQRGDNAGNVWETGVSDDVLYFRPAGDEAQTWAVDAETFDLTRSIDPMANQVKTVYKQADDRLLRKSALVDLFAVAEKYGIKRQTTHDVHTTSVTEAETVRTQIETASQDPAPQVKLTYKRLHKQGGTLADKTMLEVGDVLIARNLPPTLDVPPDNDVAFTVLGVDYDLLTDGQAVEIGAKTMIKTLSGTDKPVVVNARRKPFLLAAKG